MQLFSPVSPEDVRKCQVTASPLTDTGVSFQKCEINVFLTRQFIIIIIISGAVAGHAPVSELLLRKRSHDEFMSIKKWLSVINV